MGWHAFFESILSKSLNKKRILSALLAILLMCIDSVAPRNGKGLSLVRFKRGYRAPACKPGLSNCSLWEEKVASDDQGQFRMTDVPAGEYTVTASYVGFATFTTTAEGRRRSDRYLWMRCLKVASCERSGHGHRRTAARRGRGINIRTYVG